MKTNTPITTPEQIMDIAAAFQDSRALLSAHDLGLFTILGDKTLTAQEAAGLAGADERATDRLLSALAGMGLVVKDGDAYANTPAARKHLAADGDAPLGALSHLSRMYANWATLTDAVQAGGSVLDPEWGPGGLDAFITAMHARAVKEARLVVPRMNLAHVRRVLDVGGGSGAMAMALTEAAPDLEVTILDRPDVIEMAREFTREHPHRDRIRFQPGDMLTDAFGDGWDMVIFMQILHMFGPDTNRMLLAKAADGLTEHGAVAVQDFILDEDRTTPPFASLFALNMLVGTKEGDSYTESDIAGWLEEAGLPDTTRHETDPHHGMVVGSRP